MKKHEKEYTVHLDKNSAKCEICMKTMRKNHLKRHMKKHEKKISKNSGVMLYNDVTIEMQDFNRKKEMGRKLKVIMENNANINENALSKEKKEALEIFNLYGKSSQLLKTNWRGWQQGLRSYLNKPTEREIIWVIGTKGNEGKSFFQERVCEEFGHDKVCNMEISDSPKNIFYILKKCSSTANIFLFNLPRATILERDNYKILENIKDGFAIAGKYQSCKVRFRKPNIVIVFSNYGPETVALSEDRWNILKISKDLSSLENVASSQAYKYRPPQMENGNKKEQVNYTYYYPNSP
jgi:fructose-specific phosphotransferase system component IIB